MKNDRHEVFNKRSENTLSREKMIENTKENIKEAWQAYEAKAEYKDFNKHDMIESMLDDEEKNKK